MFNTRQNLLATTYLPTYLPIYLPTVRQSPTRTSAVKSHCQSQIPPIPSTGFSLSRRLRYSSVTNQIFSYFVLNTLSTRLDLPSSYSSSSSSSSSTARSLCTFQVIFVVSSLDIGRCVRSYPTFCLLLSSLRSTSTLPTYLHLQHGHLTNPA